MGKAEGSGSAGGEWVGWPDNEGWPKGLQPQLAYLYGLLGDILAREIKVYAIIFPDQGLASRIVL